MNCLDCPFHWRINDRDPDDWFNDDDEAVLCKKSPKSANPNSRRHTEQQPFRVVTSSARPYRTRQESETPAWCPLGLGPKNGTPLPSKTMPEATA